MLLQRVMNNWFVAAPFKGFYRWLQSLLNLFVKSCCQFYQWILCYKEFLILSTYTWVKGFSNFVNAYVGERCCQFYWWILLYKEFLISSMETWVTGVLLRGEALVKGIANFVNGCMSRCFRTCDKKQFHFDFASCFKVKSGPK